MVLYCSFLYGQRTFRLQFVMQMCYFVHFCQILRNYHHFHSCSLSLSSLTHPVMESSLEWLVRKVQLKIFLCALRRLIVKDAEKSRLVSFPCDVYFVYAVSLVSIIISLVGQGAIIKINTKHDKTRSSALTFLLCCYEASLLVITKQDKIALYSNQSRVPSVNSSL